MKDLVSKLAKYNKFWVACAGLIVMFVTKKYGVNSDIYTYLVPFLTALGVYSIPNKQ